MPVSVYYFNKIIITHNNFSSKLYLVLQSEPKTTKHHLIANKTRIQIFVILSFKILFTFFNEVVDHVDRIKVNI